MSNSLTAFGHRTLAGIGAGPGGTISPAITVNSAAALTAFNASTLNSGTIARVQSYKDFFFLDKVTPRLAIPDVVIPSSDLNWWVRMEIRDPIWQAQATWFIDPVAGSDQNPGTSLLPLLTRSELARRLDEFQLTQNLTVTINSSLNANDNRRPMLRGALSVNAPSFRVFYVGVPTVLFTGLVTGYTARNGATAQPTLMVIATLPVSWTASGLLNAVVEFSAGGGAFTRARVAQDQGARTAWLTPPINQLAQQGQVFVIGQSVSVLSMPSLGTIEQVNERDGATYSYLSAPGWQMNGAYAELVNCDGPVLQYGGSTALINHYSTNSFHVCFDGTLNIYGGKNRVNASNGAVLIRAHATLFGLFGSQVEGVGGLITPGQNTVPADVEYIGGTSLVNTDQIQGGKAIFGGFTYGTLGTGTDVVTIGNLSRDSLISFKQLPSFAGSVGINLVDAGTRASTAWLANTEVSDVNGNFIEGPNGPNQVDLAVRHRVRLTAQGILNENFSREAISASSLMIGGTVYLMSLGLKAGDLITNVLTNIFVGGTAMTLSKAGLYDSAGNRLALSLDQGAAWATAGLQVTPLIGAPFLIPATALYYLAIVAAAGVLPSPGRSATLAQAAPVPGFRPPYANMVGQVDLPVTATFNTTVAGPLGFWIGVN